MQKDTKKRSRESITEEPWRTLASHIIEQAVVDLRALTRAGAIRNWQTNRDKGFWITNPPGGQRKRVVALYPGPVSVDELLDFFNPGGHLKTFLRMAGVEMSSDTIRRELKKNCQA